jgi:hypothetical protein
METETIDKLFLELSQITTARTSKEMALTEALRHTTYHLKLAVENNAIVNPISTGFAVQQAERLLKGDSS